MFHNKPIVFVSDEILYLRWAETAIAKIHEKAWHSKPSNRCKNKNNKFAEILYTDTHVIMQQYTSVEQYMKSLNQYHFYNKQSINLV